MGKLGIHQVAGSALPLTTHKVAFVSFSPPVQGRERVLQVEDGADGAALYNATSAVALHPRRSHSAWTEELRQSHTLGGVEPVAGSSSLSRGPD